MGPLIIFRGSVFIKLILDLIHLIKNIGSVFLIDFEKYLFLKIQKRLFKNYIV